MTLGVFAVRMVRSPLSDSKIEVCYGLIRLRSRINMYSSSTKVAGLSGMLSQSWAVMQSGQRRLYRQ